MSAFAPHRLVMDLYGSECKHDIRDVGGSDRTFNAPAYECAQCWEDLLLRVYHLGYGDAVEAAARIAANEAVAPVSASPEYVFGKGQTGHIIEGRIRSLALPVETS